MSRKTPSYFSLPFLLLLAIPSGRVWAQGAPGPDVIVGNLPTLQQFGAAGSQVGLMMGTDLCNNGDTQANWFRLPETDHPVVPQNLYRMSGGADNTERFEQIGQSWAMHQFFPLQQNACGFGCTASPDSAHLGPGCSTADSGSINASSTQQGSRAWVHPFTGIFSSTSNNHTGHTHDGTSHRILVEANDLNTTMNPGATYYGEAQLVTPHEYAWCQAHPGECNMFNNVSYRQFNVSGTTSFTFSPVGSTVRMSPAINAWTGATIQMIEPEPGVDGRAFVAYKVTQFGPFQWHYEYAIYNQNLDRAIQSFSAPAGCGIGSAANLGFHAPPNHPGFANDGTQGDVGYGNVPWTAQIAGSTAIWFTETLAQNANANAIRWGTTYNFSFDGGPPAFGTATIGFFKTGTPVTIQVQGPAPECTPTPPPSPTPTPPPSPTPTATSTVTPSPTPTPIPSPAQALNLSTRMVVGSGNDVLIGGFVVSGNGAKTLVLRGLGPSLSYFPIPSPVADPILKLRAANGLLISLNDNWQDDPSQAAQLTALNLAPGHQKEAALIATLQPGAYTTILAGKNQETGLGIVEIYDTNGASGSQLANLSTRGFVHTGDNVMIGGLILGGSNNTRVVVRGIGPSLAQFGLSPVLADPTLDLRDHNGARVTANDNWQDDPAAAAQLSANGFALSDPNEAGAFISLPAGRYTVIMAGKNGGTGIGLVEIYNLR